MAAPESFHVRELAITDDGRRACVMTSSCYAWDIVDGTCAVLDPYLEHERDHRDKRLVQMSADGLYVLCADGEVVRVNDVTSMREIAVLKPGGVVRDITVCGNRAAVSVDGRVSVWRYGWGVREWEVEVEPETIGEPNGWYTHVRLVQDRVLVSRCATRVFGFRIGEPTPDREINGLDASAWSFSADGAHALAIYPGAGDARSRVAELVEVADEPRPRHTLKAGKPITCAAMTPDETVAVLGHADGTATVWKVGREKLVRMLEHPIHEEARIDAVAITPDGSTIVVTPQGADVFVWKRD